MSDPATDQSRGPGPRQPSDPGMTEPHAAATPEVEAKDIELQEQTATSSDHEQPVTQDTRSNGSPRTAFQKAVDIVTWVPKSLRYDPENPPAFGLGLNILYAIATTITVANLYYNQPVLNKIAETFDVSFERASSVATLMQSGYAAGLLFLCPMGDILRRRPFIITLVFSTAMLWLGLCLTNSFVVFSALSFICGITTTTPQLMLPLVGDVAPPNRKGAALSIVVSGLMLGMLVARLLSGIVANFTDWRNIYWLAFGLQCVLVIFLFCFMPDYPSTNPDGLNYFYALWTIIQMLFSEPLLVQACLIALLCSAVFTCFWTTLTFLLASPPYELNSLIIGVFSLIGLVGILGGPLYGRYVIDRVVPLVASIIGQVCTTIGVVVGTFSGNHTVAGPVIQAALGDSGMQIVHISNRAAIYTINPKARNRVNTAYMVAAFCGQLTGTAVGNRLYAQGGWVWSGGASIGFIGLSLIVAVAKGPRETGWFGWGGGWKISKDKPSE